MTEEMDKDQKMNAIELLIELVLPLFNSFAVEEGRVMFRQEIKSVGRFGIRHAQLA